MGFLKNKNLYNIIFLLFISGCTASVIKHSTAVDYNGYNMFGKQPSRDFYDPVTVSDSLKLLWESDANGSFNTSSVTYYDSLVFINDLSGRVFSFYIKNGKEVGVLKYKGAVYTTPIINKFKVIFAVAQIDENKSDLIYYDYDKGKLFHDAEIDGRILTELIKTNDGIIFNTEDGTVQKYDFYGTKKWQYKTNTFIHSSPALSNKNIIFGNDNGELFSVNAEKGDLNYKVKIGKSFFCGPTISEGNIYIGNDNGKLYSLKLKDGSVNWSFDSGARIMMVPAIKKNDIYFGNLDGKFYSLNSKNGIVNWTFDSKGLLSATPLLTNNIIFLPDLNKKLYLIDIRDGRVMKTLEFEGRTKLTPVIYSNIIFIGYDNGILRAYEFM